MIYRYSKVKTDDILVDFMEHVKKKYGVLATIFLCEISLRKYKCAILSPFVTINLQLATSQNGDLFLIFYPFCFYPK